MRILAVSNGLWNALATSFSTVAAVAGSVLIVRGLAPDDYGLFSYYVWLGTMIGLLGTLAVPVAITKVTSELRGNDRDDQAAALSASLLLVLVILNLVIGVFILSIALIADTRNQVVLIVIAGMLVPHSMAAVLRSTLWGHERYRPVSIVTFAAGFAQISLIAVVYLLDLGTPGYVAAIFSTHVAQAMGLSIVLWRSGNDGRALSSGPKLEASVRRKYVAFLVPASLLLLLDVPRQRAGILILERFRDLQEVGYFNLSYTIFASLLAMGVAVISAYNPALSRDFGARDWDQIRVKVPQGLALAALFAVPMTFGGWATFDRVMELFYGDKMLSAIPVTQVLLTGLLPGVVIAMLSFTANALGGIWVLVRAGLFVSPVAVILLLILVPPFGALGAAWAVIGTQLAYAALLTAVVWRTYRIPIPYGTIARTVALGAVATFAVPLLIQAYVPGVIGLIAAVIAAALIYLAGLWIFGQLQPFGHRKAINQDLVR